MARLILRAKTFISPKLGRTILAIAIIYVARFGITGCTSYPIYTSGGVAATPRSQPAQVDINDHQPDSDRSSTRLRVADDDSQPEPDVDPVIFSRVVKGYLGIPYKLGGGDHKGIDCSYLVHALYRDYDGRRLPPLTRDLVRQGYRVTADDLLVGDLVFFSFNGSNVSHVGVYMGDNRFVHASESQGVVISSLRESVYRDRYVGARRLK